MQDHMIVNGLFSGLQSAYRKNHSTERKLSFTQCGKRPRHLACHVGSQCRVLYRGPR